MESKLPEGVIYKCDSINNTYVREGELNILEKHEDELYFVFGANMANAKKRYYKDLKTLNKDFSALVEMKKAKDNPPRRPSRMNDDNDM